ncbi:unnamed protein product [Macrosiphum euphorbiae]|uniref:Uncharacterized protein n=1 Tax=Macrosiphum euphorbiae TaxID=13131 RepID=A0AAV0Y5N4_9HEMI|nr:unnamed protein product [Macrosiphum euphorbiae]
METETDSMLGVQVTKFAVFNETEENYHRSVHISIVHCMSSHIVILILLLIMIIWFWFFGDHDDLAHTLAQVNKKQSTNKYGHSVHVHETQKDFKHTHSQTTY